MDLALNSPWWLICHKTRTNKQIKKGVKKPKTKRISKTKTSLA